MRLPTHAVLRWNTECECWDIYGACVSETEARWLLDRAHRKGTTRVFIVALTWLEGPPPVPGMEKQREETGQ